MITQNSLQYPYDLIWSGDPALAAPVRKLDEDDAAWAATEESWAHRLRIAREHGVWDTILKPGELPTLFRVRQMPGTLMRRLFDAERSREIGALSASAMALRICLLSISNLGTVPYKFEMVHHPVFGQIAAEKVIDDLDAISPDIAIELGSAVNQRAWSPPGK